MEMDDTEAREFIRFEITVLDQECSSTSQVFEKGEFWFGGDMLFISHGRETDGERRLEIFNTRYIKSVSLRYGV